MLPIIRRYSLYVYSSWYVPTQLDGHAGADLVSTVLQSGFQLDYIVHQYIVDYMSIEWVNTHRGTQLLHLFC
jgi:hypothetical protein